MVKGLGVVTNIYKGLIVPLQIKLILLRIKQLKIILTVVNGKETGDGRGYVHIRVYN